MGAGGWWDQDEGSASRTNLGLFKVLPVADWLRAQERRRKLPFSASSLSPLQYGKVLSLSGAKLWEGHTLDHLGSISGLFQIQQAFREGRFLSDKMLACKGASSTYQILLQCNICFGQSVGSFHLKRSPWRQEWLTHVYSLLWCIAPIHKMKSSWVNNTWVSLFNKFMWVPTMCQAWFLALRKQQWAKQSSRFRGTDIL